MSAIDGKDAWLLLVGATEAPPHEALFFYYRENDLEGVRMGRWKGIRKNILTQPDAPRTGQRRKAQTDRHLGLGPQPLKGRKARVDVQHQSQQPTT